MAPSISAENRKPYSPSPTLGIALSQENGFPEWLSWGQYHRGWALAELGHVADGIAEMENGIAGLLKLGGAPRFSLL